MVIECTAKTNVDELKGFLPIAGATEISVQYAEPRWWLGLMTGNNNC